MAEATLSERTRGFSTAYQWYALGVLFVVYVFNFIDRSVLALLAQSIKDDLQISDAALGLLSGLAFAVFYTGLGVPIARLADRGNRRNILVVCLSIWSAMTALCGFAQSYLHLLAARIGVAIGEAGGSPPSHSMISDMFPQSRRATALGIYALGIPVGSMIGALAGGVLNDLMSWRAAFVVVGVPGLLLALIVRLTLREPPRGLNEPERGPVRAEAAAAPPVAQVFRLLWQRSSFRWLSISAGFQAFMGYGSGAWVPAMFERTHHLSSTSIGTALFWLGVPSAIGTFLGGWYGDRLGHRDVRWYMWLPAITTFVSVPFSVFCYLTSNPWLAFWMMIVPNMLGAYWLAPVFSLTQGLAGLRMRAVAASIMLFVLNLIGMGLGPWGVGVVSDALRAHTQLGVDSLRWSLVLSQVFAFVAIYCCIRGARTLKADLARGDETR